MEVAALLPNIVSDECNSHLLAPVSNNEIKSSVFDLGGMKAPVPDGFPGIFYQQHWAIVGDVACNAVRMLKTKENGSFKGLKLSRPTPAINNVLFVDDTLLFGRATMKEALTIMEIIKKYSAATDKRSKYKYLGLPSFWGRSKSKALQFIQDRIASKTQSWKQKLLSQAGQETLIKSVLYAIPSCAMTILKFPKGVCNQISSLMSNFWWDIKEKEKKLHWISWRKASQPKTKGGLGFRDINLFNEVCLAKQCWLLLNSPNSLWARILKGRYFPHFNFWEASPTRKGSWIWNSLLTSRDILKEGTRFNISDGTKTLIWFDPWVPTLQDFRVVRPNHRPSHINLVLIS
ncbi:uncharacterized protein LOC110634121 [Hevea brasiliensis]|uniref:uncharacterized protein LOC110634121 n=1 Tax=Hevea brasiliensis TaxID=3981 RepID=UPI0025E5A986|nr:uncharacterized protein LOC110634121 [Hevea brasiliensis]